MGTRGRGRVGRDGTWLTRCGRQQQQKKELQRKDFEKLRKEDVDISKSEKEQHNILKGSVSLLTEAEGKLADAIKAGNMEMISVAHGLLEVARCRMDSATGKLSALAGKRKICNDKRGKHESSSSCKAILAKLVKKS